MGRSLYKKYPLPHYNVRPKGMKIDTLVVHSMFAITCKERFSVRGCIAALNRHKLSAHYLIGRSGTIYELVAPRHRAWHAGVSKLPFRKDQRENVNNFSIGVELVATLQSGFTRRQYTALDFLIAHLKKKYPLKIFVGHDEIAPTRKRDPGKRFDWTRVKEASRS